jgi:hypothetical protein
MIEMVKLRVHYKTQQANHERHNENAIKYIRTYVMQCNIMYLCMHVFMYVCRYVYMYMYVHMHIYVCMRVCMCPCVCVCMY